MTPEDYLTDTGKEIFERLIIHVQAMTMPIDSINLSTLANAIDLEQRVMKDINFPDDPKFKNGVQKTHSGYTAVTGNVTVLDKCRRIIDTLGAKYGLTPADREKIKAFKEKKKIDPIEDALNKLKK